MHWYDWQRFPDNEKVVGPSDAPIGEVTAIDTETKDSEFEMHQDAGGTELLPYAFARRFGVVITDTPSDLDGRLTVACRSKPDLTTMAELRRFAGRGFVLEDVGDEEFDQLLGRVYARDGSQARQMVEDIDDELDLARLADALPETEDLLEREDDAPIIRLINALLTQAVRENASDVHIETFEKVLQVRFRVDGVLREVVQPRRALAPLLVSRIKVMAKLDIAEKRIPQDGRIPLRIGGA